MKNDQLLTCLEKIPEILKKDLEQNLCTCNDVLKIDIIKTIASGATTLDEVKNKTYASEGIGCCKQQIERLIDCIH